jgi:rubredoxin
MRICKICGHPFREENDIPKNPIEILGELFQKSVSQTDDSDLCQACKKERGMLNLMGFSE